MTYKTYTIQPDFRNPYNKDPEFMFYPTADGIQHDADGDSEGYRYTGNCKWADSIEEAKDEIDELVPDAKYYVRVSSCYFTPDRRFTSFFEAFEYAKYWNADLLIKENDVLCPITNP